MAANIIWNLFIRKGFEMEFIMIVVFLFSLLLSSSRAFKTYSFENLPDNFLLDITEDSVYSGRLQYFGGLSSYENKTVTIATTWFNADRFMFYFETLDVKGVPGSCSDAYLQIFDDTNLEKETVKAFTLTGLEDRLCGKEIINGSFTSVGNRVSFKYVPSKENLNSWSVIFTAFHAGHCKSYEYRCGNERCISHSLRCQGHDPCGDGSDCLMTTGAMAAIALGGACAVGFLTSVIFVVYKNRKRLYRKHKRQPHTFTPAHSFENLTAADFCQETVTRLNGTSQKC